MSQRYCIYCGQDQSNGHSAECPIVAGIPKAVWGLYPRRGDVEYNLSLGRFGILWTINKGHLGPEDPKIRDRLVYESAAFRIRRTIWQQTEYESEKTKLSDGWLSRRRKRKLDRKLKELEKKIDEEREGFKESVDLKPGSKLSTKSFDKLLHIEKVHVQWQMRLGFPLALSLVPVFRDPETLELIYLPPP